MREHNRQFVESSDPDTQQSIAKGYTAEVTMAAILGPVIHTLWMVGRLGRAALEPTKQVHATAKRPKRWLSSALCLGALGFRNERLRAEARKAIGVRPAFADQDETPVAVLDAVQKSLQLALERPVEVTEEACVRPQVQALLPACRGDLTRSARLRPKNGVEADASPAARTRTALAAPSLSGKTACAAAGLQEDRWRRRLEDSTTAMARRAPGSRRGATGPGGSSGASSA
jgi:hypothetical protein